MRLFVSYITAAGSVCDLVLSSGSVLSPFRQLAGTWLQMRMCEGSTMQTPTATTAGTATANLVWRIVLPTILACGFASTLAWICLVGYGAIVLTSLAF